MEFTTSSVLTRTFSSTIGAFTGYAAFQQGGSNFILSYDALNYWTYNEKKNIFEGQNEITGFCYISKITTDSTGKIISFTPKTVFHALDYNDKSTISGWSMPSSRYIDLTLGASGSTYTAPANGYFDFIHQGSNGQFLFLKNTSNQFEVDSVIYNQGFARVFIPCKKGDIIRVEYNADGSYARLYFYYAEGETNV